MAHKRVPRYRHLDKCLARLEAQVRCPRHQTLLVCPGCDWEYLDGLTAQEEAVLLGFLEKATVRPTPPAALEEAAHGLGCGRCGEYPLICERCVNALGDYDLGRLSDEEVAMMDALLEPILGNRRPIA